MFVEAVVGWVIENIFEKMKWIVFYVCESLFFSVTNGLQFTCEKKMFVRVESIQNSFEYLSF